MTLQQGGWSPAAKTALTLGLIAVFVFGSVATILLTMRRKDGSVVPWNAGGGDQPMVVRGGGATAQHAPLAPPTIGLTATTAASQGLRLTFTSTLDPTRTDTRVARLLALTVKPGDAPSLGVPPGPFEAVFSGSLEVDLRDRYRLAFEGTGSLTLEIAGKAVLVGDLAAPGRIEGDSVRLGKGQNALVARYRSPADGEARLRVLWTCSEFAWEPVAPTVLAPAPLAGHEAAAARRAGHALAARLQCGACHAGGIGWATAPALEGVGSRLRPEWLRGWLLAPERGAATLRSMPHLFAADEAGRREAEDVVAFLATLRTDVPASAPGHDLVAAGGESFAHLGCVGCHLLPDAAGPGDGRIPLRDVATKFAPGALQAYLRAPHRLDPMGGMPDFALDEAEAAALAAFLLARAKVEDVPPLAGDATRGRAIAQRKGCANCHAGSGLDALEAPAWTSLQGVDCKGPPRFAFSDAARAALQTVVGKAHPESLAERGERLVRGLRCTACHGLDGGTDAFTSHMGEVSDLLPPLAPDAHVVDQSRPALTWAGEKLQPSFVRRQLTDVLGARSRPWLHARMPAFHGHADVLAGGLAASHGVGDVDVVREPDARLAAVGADLISAEKGFACVTCHGVGGQGPLQVFEVQGINFARTANRLRPDYFMRWMRDPRRIDPATKMARYSTPEGKTGFTTVLDGDADRQFDAIHAWIVGLKGR